MSALIIAALAFAPPQAPMAFAPHQAPVPMRPAMVRIAPASPKMAFEGPALVSAANVILAMNLMPLGTLSASRSLDRTSARSSV